MNLHVKIHTDDFERLLKLFGDILEFEVLEKTDNAILFRGNGSTIEIIRDKKNEIEVMVLAKDVKEYKKILNNIKENYQGEFMEMAEDKLELLLSNDTKIVISVRPTDIPYKLSGDKLLVTRRSIRFFQDKEVPDEVLWKIFELCRFSPTSKNSQSYYFVVIKDKGTLDWLASLRGPSSAPIGRAPMAIAICSDPEKSRRHIQDGDIAAYHFMLAAWFYGLGTCWIAAMDRDDVKEKLGIPKHHYIATITPLGYPKYIPSPPPRKPAEYFVRNFKI